MNHVNRNALVPYTPAQMYALVNDVEDYPKFLPWCRKAQVESRTDKEVQASLELARGGLHKRFTTRNTLHPEHAIDIALVRGPFRHLQGHWRFEPLAEGSKVVLDMAFEFANPLLGVMLGPVFSEICNTLVSSFTRRAADVYGKR
jgi:ribosome-associated toxin RatA of RatAB toxin-antitoxin module